MGISRTTQDSARITGALTGAGLVAMFGIGPAYTGVVALYLLSVVLTLKVAALAPEVASRTTAVHPRPAARPSPWRDLREGMAYVWHAPQLLSVMILAFMINVTAFPLVNGLLPYVAREVYLTDQTGLGYMVASLAFGAVMGSLILSHYGSTVRAARTMIVTCVMWYLLLLWFAQIGDHTPGTGVLVLVGVAQSFSQVSMQTMLLRSSEAHVRGRIMGLRQLAIYGLPIGLLISGPLIAHFGWRATASVYCVTGLALTLLIAYRWRAHLWHRDAVANSR
jgi:Na+/melibiose symporter-like transporter